MNPDHFRVHLYDDLFSQVDLPISVVEILSFWKIIRNIKNYNAELDWR